ncbi:stellacyanin-like [Durio zibethinus]|uniref:Stellacyanin-like n=1 Tax=Durio zibethinus TaxID=66656 RepID=A0A6P5ZUN7_DURZI|nr:stellacyanin-like [Durio zibethinus]
MARKISMAALSVVLAATLVQITYARTYTVGDSISWQIPNSNADFYDDWAENKDFMVGDVLVFNFTTGAHNVAEVTEVAYDACSTTDTIFTENNGPARITLKRTGEYYFICTFPAHCFGGQKLKVDVRNGASTTPGILGPPSSASSLVATLYLVSMSIALVLLC